MKKQLLFTLLVFTFISCGDNANDDKAFKAYVNKWTHEYMEALYYWNTQLPAFKKSYSEPNDYFRTLIYKDDRFSAFFENYDDLMNRLSGISPAEIGFEFQLYRASKTSNDIVAYVQYTKPNTHAKTLGIKRGDIINRINGVQLTIDNYRTLLGALTDASASTKLGFATRNNDVYSNAGELVVNKSANYQEHPVLVDTVYNIGNKKIAYLMYNFFTADPGDKTLKYDLALNAAMAKYNSENINELIVDLRYNRGGMMSSATKLGSMLVPYLTADKVFSYTEYNKNYTDYFNSAEYKKKYSNNPFVDYFVTNITVSTSNVQPINNVGAKLQRIFFLTGNSTASASEMVINGLKPYLPCILVGDTTTGKNVGSVVVNDENNKNNKYAFMPIVLKYFNKDKKSDFTFGFAPDFYVKDDYNHQLGDVNEALLAKALTEITGVKPAKVQGNKAFEVDNGQRIMFKEQHLLIVDDLPIVF